MMMDGTSEKRNQTDTKPRLGGSFTEQKSGDRPFQLPSWLALSALPSFSLVLWGGDAAQSAPPIIPNSPLWLCKKRSEKA